MENYSVEVKIRWVEQGVPKIRLFGRNQFTYSKLLAMGEERYFGLAKVVYKYKEKDRVINSDQHVQDILQKIDREEKKKIYISASIGLEEYHRIKPIVKEKKKVKEEETKKEASQKEIQVQDKIKDVDCKSQMSQLSKKSGQKKKKKNKVKL